ncbi:DUF1223 domain-containing protein [Litoreibacter janthinus]|uniref:Secreted protein n=1 Tax=Litoreibacter janthinus TaxID=670154 RepID=A0A1I6GRK5_9RHOB|nr:DUF1223 domain-containing protein [Litoreibacter janthinus]SFR44844.1 hypothetical protein SAMN04488002_1889 [Litoreibacter janthinus]
MIKRLTSTALTSLTIALAVPAHADGPVVVELFTSQGCSSCPPADVLLGELANRQDVIALALHVDYWDYLGWVDEFAQPAHTARQRGYARAANSTMIYTPQMVVEGQEQIVGTKGMKLAEHIDRHKSRPSRVKLTLNRDGAGKVRILAQAAGEVTRKMLVQVVRYMPEKIVDIRSGENAGKSMTYHNIVESIVSVADWDGKTQLDVKADAAGENPVVVLIQEGSSGPILAAARID